MRIIVPIFILALVGDHATAQQFRVGETFTTRGSQMPSTYETEVSSANMSHVYRLLGSGGNKSNNAAQYIDSEVGRMARDLKKSGIDDKKNRKAAEIFHERVAVANLKKYDNYANFEQLFKSGAYNSATATALHALILEQLQIPYIIRVEPTRVYLVLWPNEHPTAIYADAPSEAKNDDQFMAFYLKLITEIGLTEEAGRDDKSDKVLFYRYFGPEKETVNLVQLAGILHYQQALVLYKNRQYFDALAQIDQAQALYNVPRNEVIRYACLFQLAKEQPGDEVKRLDYLFQLYELHPVQQVRDAVLKQFLAVAGQSLFEQCQADQLTTHYQAMRAKLAPALRWPMRCANCISCKCQILRPQRIDPGPPTLPRQPVLPSPQRQRHPGSPGGTAGAIAAAGAQPRRRAGAIGTLYGQIPVFGKAPLA
ncbi:MAG: hypothetical protein IPN33_04875 [Saprospiraceae bacterium]|nr:hypothetical protein [Saprospiraceae bacterium]